MTMDEKEMTNKITAICIIIILIIGSIIGSFKEDPTPRCAKLGCDSTCASGSSYCYLHKPITISREDYEPGYKNTKGKSSSGNIYSSTYSYSSGKSNMPDCDDYDSYEEFMDDWDGCMPDGSDAEDYWGNW